MQNFEDKMYHSGIAEEGIETVHTIVLHWEAFNKQLRKKWEKVIYYLETEYPCENEDDASVCMEVHGRYYPFVKGRNGEPDNPESS